MLYSKAYNKNRPGAREQAMYRLKCSKKRKRLKDAAKAAGLKPGWQIQAELDELKEKQKQSVSSRLQRMQEMEVTCTK